MRYLHVSCWKFDFFCTEVILEPISLVVNRIKLNGVRVLKVIYISGVHVLYRLSSVCSTAETSLVLVIFILNTIHLNGETRRHWQSVMCVLKLMLRCLTFLPQVKISFTSIARPLLFLLGNNKTVPVIYSLHSTVGIRYCC